MKTQSKLIKVMILIFSFILVSSFSLGAISVTINSPANETKSGTALTINYTATNPNANNLTCTIYRDGILNVTQTATNGTSTTASPTMNKGSYLYSYYVNCTDGLNIGLSETRYFLYSNYTSGNGTTDNPFLITNCTELQNMKDGLYSNYALANNIDCSATYTWNAGQGFIPIGNLINNFTGTFNGNNYSIDSLFMNSNLAVAGLFGSIAYPSVISNLVLTNGNFTYSPTSYFNEGVNTQAFGSIVGMSSGNLINISVSANIYANKTSNAQINTVVGGLVGIGQANISYSSFTGIITSKSVGGLNANYFLGGIVGYADYRTTLDKVYSITTINGSEVSGFNKVSGIANCYPSSCLVNNSWTNSNMTVTNRNSISGIAGSYDGDIRNSYALGSLTATSSAFALSSIGRLGAGYNIYNVSCSNSYTAMSVNYTGTWTIYDTVDGTASGCSYKSNASQMNLQSTYNNWDFVDTWKWDTATNLPILRAEGDQSGYYPEGTVTLTSPANNTISSSLPVINFTVSSTWASTTNCTLYLNSVANETINDVNNNTMTSFTPAVSLGSYDYYVSCVDGWNTMTTPSQNYIYFENNIPSVTATAYTPPTAYTNDEILFNATCEHNDVYTDGITAHCQLYNGTTAYNSEITKTVTNNTNTNICNVSANIVKKDENWKAQFFCSDNISSGTAVNSSAITISNTAPVFTQSNFVYATLDNISINLQINATDLDLDSLTYSINDTNFEIGSSSGIITKTTAIAEEYNVSVNVTDGTATTIMWVFFDIEVSNYAPEIIGTDAVPTTAYKDTQLNFSVQCTEIDDEILNGECQLYNGTTAYGSVIETAVYNNTMGVVCTLPANTGNKGETWKAELWCNDGGMNSDKMNTTGITILNTIPSINFNSPINNTSTYKKEKINFSVSDIDLDTIDCTLYLDDEINANNPSIVNNAINIFTPIWSYGNHTFYVNCTDGIVNTITGVYNFEFQVPPYYYFYDDIDPYLNSVHEDEFYVGITTRLALFNWSTSGSYYTGYRFSLRSDSGNPATISQNFSDNIDFYNQSWNAVVNSWRGSTNLYENPLISFNNGLSNIVINLNGEGLYSNLIGTCGGDCFCPTQACYKTSLNTGILDTLLAYNSTTKQLFVNRQDGCSITMDLSICNLENSKTTLTSSSYFVDINEFKISNEKINFAPLFSDTELTYAVKDDELISIQLNATDFNQDTLTFSTINTMFPISSSGLITNNSVSVGDYVVEYNVTDGTVSDGLIVTFNVTLGNTAPILTSTNAEPTTAYKNTELTFSATCTDSESSTITAYCQIYNNTIAYDSLSTVNISKDVETAICIVPSNIVNKNENWKAELSCSDGMFITESQNTSVLTIQNTAPTFTDSDFSHYMNDRESISIQLNASDLDEDSLTFSTLNSMFPISSSGLITNNSVAVGDYVVLYNVTDGTATDSMSVTFNVSLGNTAPTLTNVSSRPATSYKNTELTFSLTCADVTNASVVGYCQIYNDTTPYGSQDSLLVSVNTQTDVCVLPSNSGNKGETWKAELWCGDGEFNSSSSYTNSITLLNTAPVFTQSNFIITHHTTEDLSVQINATDLDSDSLIYSINDTNFDISSSTGLLTRSGQASTTAGNYNVSVSINDGDTTVTMWVYFILTQNSPIIIISNPANESVKTESFDISFTVTDSDTPTTDCFAYLDSVSLSNMSSVANNTLTTISTSFSVGNHNLYINCNDGIITSTSGVYSFYYDNTAVVINSFAPNIFNTTVFNGYSMNIIGNVTGNDLSLVSRTIYYPNLTVLFNEEQTIFSDPDFYNWSESYTTSDYPNGIYTMNINAEDVLGHTNNKDISFEVGNCVPEWICNSYGTCGITDTRACNGVADSHVCGIAYTGDYSEFDDISCNFCSRNIVPVNQTVCYANLLTATYEDLNFSTCCDVTGIGTDCYNDVIQNVSTYSIEQSCSLFTYEEEDIPKALWNTVVKFVLSFKSLI
jgi:hypothetical protein